MKIRHQRSQTQQHYLVSRLISELSQGKHNEMLSLFSEVQRFRPCPRDERGEDGGRKAS